MRGEAGASPLARFRADLVKRPLLSIGLLFVVAVGFTACAQNLSAADQSRQAESRAGPVTDYARLMANLRAAGATVKPGGEVDQPFFSVTGKMINVHGEDVQVFQYSRPAAADAQAALVSPDGSAVGTSIVHWIGPPHFYKKTKLIVLYAGNNSSVLKALDAVLGPQFAGK